LQQNRPGIVLTSVAELLPEAAQSLPVTMYVAGFPCQPYSSEGVGLGWKPIVQRRERLENSLECILLENVCSGTAETWIFRCGLPFADRRCLNFNFIGKF